MEEEEYVVEKIVGRRKRKAIPEYEGALPRPSARPSVRPPTRPSTAVAALTHPLPCS